MSQRSRHPWSVLALLIAVVGAAALVLFAPKLFERSPRKATAAPSPQPLHALMPPKTVAAHVPLAAPAPQPGSRYTPGAQRSYVVDMQIEAALEAGATNAAGSPAAAAMELSIEGQWVETFVAGMAGIARYHVALSDSTVFMSRRPAGALRSELEAPFYIELDNAGAVKGLYFERTTSVLARGILKSAVALRQVIVRPGEQWKTTEQDSTGEYEANYTRAPDPLEITKRRVRYTRLSTARGLRPVADVGTAEIEDHTRITLNTEDELEQLEAKSQTKVRTGEGLPTAVGKLVASFVLSGRAVDTTRLEDFERRRGELDRVEMLTKPDVSPSAEAWRESDAQIVGTATLADLVGGLKKIPVDDRRARAEAMARLRSDFRLRPKDAERAALLVETTAVADGKTITAALGGVGSPEAERSLIAIVDNGRVPLPVRLNASTAILLLKQPTPAVVSSLRRQMDDSNEHIRGASSLALGSVLQRLTDEHAGERERGLGALIASFRNATNAVERVIALRSLGNSGDARVVALAQEAYSDEHPELRVAAVHAVRFVPGDQAEALITKAMLNDPEAHVRIQAIETATAHRFVPTYFQVYDAILAADRFPLVRRAVVQSLSKSSAAPQAIALLHRAETDPSEDVRVIATMALQNPSPASP
jgi:HEAT repeat protein